MLGKLHKRIVIYIMLTAGIIYILISALSFYIVGSSLKKSYIALSESYFDRVTGYTSNYFDDIYAALANKYIRSLIIQQIEKGNCSEILDSANDEIAAQTPGVINCAAFDADGNSLAVTYPDKDIPLFERLNMDGISTVGEDKSASIHLVSAGEHHDSMISALSPIYTDDGCIGYYFIDVSIDYIYNLLSSYRATADSDAQYLIVNTDTVIPDPDADGLLAESGIISLADDSTNSEIRAMLSRDGKYIVCEKNIAASFKIASVTPTTEYQSRLKQLALILLGLIILLMLITFFIAALISRHTVTPLNRLLNRMENNKDIIYPDSKSSE